MDRVTGAIVRRAGEIEIGFSDERLNGSADALGMALAETAIGMEVRRMQAEIQRLNAELESTREELHKSEAELGLLRWWKAQENERKLRKVQDELDWERGEPGLGARVLLAARLAVGMIVK